MSNYYGNPLILDTVWTASTIPAQLKSPTGPTDTTNTRNSPIMARRIVWHGSTASGSVVIADIAQVGSPVGGNVIVEYTIPPASSQVGEDVLLWGQNNIPLKLKMNGWILETLSSGVIIIYY